MAEKVILLLVDIEHEVDAGLFIQQAFKTFPSGDFNLAYVMPYGFFSYVEPFVSDESVKSAAKRAHQKLDTRINLAVMPVL